MRVETETERGRLRLPWTPIVNYNRVLLRHMRRGECSHAPRAVPPQGYLTRRVMHRRWIHPCASESPYRIVIAQTTVVLSSIIPTVTAAMDSAKVKALVHHFLWAVGSRVARHGTCTRETRRVYGRSAGTNRLKRPCRQEPFDSPFRSPRPPRPTPVPPPGLRKLPHFRRRESTCSHETSTPVPLRQAVVNTDVSWRDHSKRTRYFLRACPMTQCLGGRDERVFLVGIGTAANFRHWESTMERKSSLA